MVHAFALLALGAAAGASVTELFRARRLVSRLRAVALCSHELRGALTAIGLALSGLERSFASERRRVEALRRGYDRAVSVARDLEVARGALPARIVQRPEPIDLRELAGRLVDTWNASLPPGCGQLVLDWRAGAPVVQGYPMRLTQALDNLIANAIEHGRGPVTIMGRIGDGCVSLSVLDRGAGLKRTLEELRPHSWQARRGHGLVVTRHAVELHGGTLRPVRGPLGCGIEVLLPTGTGPAAVRAAAKPVQPQRSGSGAAAP